MSTVYSLVSERLYSDCAESMLLLNIHYRILEYADHGLDS